MSGGPAPDVVAASDRIGSTDAVAAAIADYAEGCRRRIPDFVASQFTLTHAWQVQRQTLWSDLFIGPVNAIWAVPYLALTRICRGLDALGVPGASRALRAVPRGIPSGYQRAVEQLIVTRLLGWDRQPASGLPDALRRECATRGVERAADLLQRAEGADAFRVPLDQFAAGRDLLADLSGTAATLGLGWLAFDKPSLGLGGLSEQLAGRSARARAASHFVLGRRAGSVFYAVFRPQANPVETGVILAGLALLVGAVVVAAGLLCEPLHQRLGLHERRLRVLVDTVERDLLLLVHRLRAQS